MKKAGLSSRQKIGLKIAAIAVAAMLVIALMGSILKTSESMLTGIVTDNNARTAMLKDCEKQARDKGLKQQEYTDAWNKCVAAGNAGLSAQSK